MQYTGWGASNAIVGGYQVAASLQQAWRDAADGKPDLEGAMRSYEASMRPRLEAIQQGPPEWLPALQLPVSAAGVRNFNLVLGTVARLIWLSRTRVGELVLGGLGVAARLVGRFLPAFGDPPVHLVDVAVFDSKASL